MSKNLPSERDDDFPITPDGAKVTDEYLMLIEPSINLCGDRMLDLWRDYKHGNPLDTSKLNQCAEQFEFLMKKFGQIPFAITVTVFYDNLHADEDVNTFNMCVANFFHAMPDSVHLTVERLRYLNTKFIEKRNTIASQLR